MWKHVLLPDLDLRFCDGILQQDGGIILPFCLGWTTFPSFTKSYLFLCCKSDPLSLSWKISWVVHYSQSWDQLNLPGLLYIFRHCYLNFISVNFVKHCIFHTVRRLRFRLLKLVIGTWKELLMFSTANHKLLLLILDIWKSSTTDIKVNYFTLCCAYHLFYALSLIFFYLYHHFVSWLLRTGCWYDNGGRHITALQWFTGHVFGFFFLLTLNVCYYAKVSACSHL